MIGQSTSGSFTPTEFLIMYILTIVLIAFKIGFGIYLRQKNKKSEYKNHFVRATMVMMYAFALSRFFYFIFDFYLTKFNMELYFNGNNIWFWKIGNSISSVAIAYLLFVLDKYAFNKKFKGIFCYGILIIAIIQFTYPVNDIESFRKSLIINTLGIIFTAVVPISFLYLGFKTSGDLRKSAFIITIGILLYGFVGITVNDVFLTLIGAAEGTSLRALMYVLYPLLKIVGLGIVAFTITKFKLYSE